mgnify:CR=1 FL=1
MLYFQFFDSVTSTTEIYSLSLPDALPISELRADGRAGAHQTIQPQTNAGAEASLTAPSMKHHVTNDAAIDILKSYEGLALEAYPEADYWLIGYGHKGRQVHQGMTITALTAGRYLRQDLRSHEDYIRSVVLVPLNENEFSALVILNYNIGNGAFRNSTVLRLLNEGDRKATADAFLMWNKIKRNGKLSVSTPLTARREAERDLFLASR